MKGNDSEIMTAIKVIALAQEGKDRMARDGRTAEKLQAFKEGKDSEESKGVITTGKGREGQRGKGGKDKEKRT